MVAWSGSYYTGPPKQPELVSFLKFKKKHTVFLKATKSFNILLIQFYFYMKCSYPTATVPDMEICWSNVLSLAQSTDSLSISGLGMEFTRLGSALASAYSRLVLKGWTSETPRTLFDMGIHGIPCYYSWTLRTSDCWQASILLKCICHSHVGSCWVDFSCRPAIDLHEVWQVKVPWMD